MLWKEGDVAVSQRNSVVTGAWFKRCQETETEDS